MHNALENTPQHEALDTLSPWRFGLYEDTSAPTQSRPAIVHDVAKAFNQSLLLMPQNLARRVKLRFSPEVWIRFGRKSWYFKRLRSNSVILSCPNAEPAELAVNAILAFAASLDGKWLAPAPETAAAPTPGQKQAQEGK